MRAGWHTSSAETQLRVFLRKKNLPYALGDGTTAAPGTSIARQLTRNEITMTLLPMTRRGCLMLLFPVTIFLCHDRVSCGPSAFHCSGSRFSSSLSRIGPQLHAASHCNGGPLLCCRNLTCRTLESLVDKSGQHLTMIHREHNRSWKAKHLLAQTTVVEVVAVVVVVDAVCASFVATTVILEIV